MQWGKGKLTMDRLMGGIEIGTPAADAAASAPATDEAAIPHIGPGASSVFSPPLMEGLCCAGTVPDISVYVRVNNSWHVDTKSPEE